MQKYKLLNGGDIILNDNDFIAKGGEGSIYGKNNRAFKIYETKDKMPPIEKLKELQQLKDNQNIMAPIDIILEKNNIPIGFSMIWIKNTETLCRLFTTSFLDRTGITIDKIVTLIENIKNLIAKVHEKEIIIVDGNEFNWLVDNKDFTIPFAIDVNCWQTPNFPADAILPSIRDYSTDKFTKLTDWYSFAIVSFQLFTGLHPFKGRMINGSKLSVVERMKNGISVLDNKTVRIPDATRDFGNIPKNYMEWYTQIFRNNKRVLPPDIAGKIVIAPTTLHKIITSTQRLKIKLIESFSKDILYFKSFINLNTRIIKTKNKTIIGTHETSYTDYEVIIHEETKTPILVKSNNEGYLEVKSITNHTVNDINIYCNEILIIDNMLYCRNLGQLTEMDFTINKDKIQPTVKIVWDVMPNSTTIFSNILIQQVLNRILLSIPIPDKKKSKMITKSISELIDCKIINAKYSNQVAIISVFINNEYKKYVFKFNEDFSEYKLRIIDDCDNTAINFVVLPNGVIVHIYKDEELEVFQNRYNIDSIAQVQDSAINMDMKLSNNGMKVIFSKNHNLYEVSLT